MDPLGPVHRFDAFQQQHKPLAIPMAVIRKFGNDQAGNLAALIAYYGFFSLFPLLLVFTTILGFVLSGNPSAQSSVENGVLAQFPIIGHDIKLHALSGSVAALVIGLLTSLWAGLGVTQASQQAFDRVWAVPFKDRPNFLQSRLRGLGLLAFLGTLFLVSTLASGLVSGGLGGTLAKFAGYVISLLVNLALFLAAFRLMTARTIATRELWPGAVIAGVLWTLLQSLIGYYIGHVIKHASGVGAEFGVVIGLLVWLHLGAQITLYAAEINVVVTRHLWPRSLLGPPEAPADERTLTALAKVEERSDEQHVEVQFRR